ncbi:unnamed protein product [Peronospora farinosa]|uniref:Arf-GAP domain-containing protein n=1 Tax=Peronospora farinosa TaxID=134698 RepID=A0AAV0TK07_9STRA|nr:unnamed protein product [Peronospora farinosa]CAI5721931.1 unnamed protein product [Peronospora farinosa]
MMSEAESAVNALKKLEVNKTCVNCGNYNRFGHQNVCEKVRTFVCSNCKSAHQSYSMRVKSVSMSNWTMDEVDALREQNGGGNAVAARVWYGRWDESQMRKPSKEDALDYYKQFINRVYNEKAFYDENGCSGIASFTGIPAKSSGQLTTAVPVTNLLDFDTPTQTQDASSKNLEASGSSDNDGWGDFAAAPVSATSNDEFGAFVSASAPTSMPECNGFADFSAASGSPASMDLFGDFVSALPASTSKSFDVFADSDESVLTLNAPSSNGPVSFDPFAPAPTTQGQQPASCRLMNKYNAVPAFKDYSVFDGLSSPSYGTPHHNKNSQACGSVGMKMNGHGQQLGMQHSGGSRQQQQHHHVQPMMGCGNAGMNISTYFSPNAAGVTGNLSAYPNGRDPFAGLGL